MKTKVKIGDKVKVISGNEKGLIGSILSFSSSSSSSSSSRNFNSNLSVIIEGSKSRFKSEKTQTEEKEKKEENKKSKVREIPKMIHISNVMLWDKEQKTTSKVFYKIENGEKKRIFKKSKFSSRFFDGNTINNC